MQISTEKYETLMDEIAYLRSKQPKWISVKDRLPDSGSDVLAFAEDHCIYTALFDGIWWLSGDAPSYKVTHWMPLPEPPEVEDEIY